METWDILDSNGAVTGQTIVRGKPLAPGQYHLVVHIWLQDSDGNYLIQKRPDNLAWMPGIWGTTGGSVIAGEDSLTAAIRETREEMGVTLAETDLVLFKRLQRTNDFTDIWIARVDKSAIHSFSKNSEVDYVKWVSRAELRTMADNGLFVKYDYLEKLIFSGYGDGTPKEKQ